MREIRKVKYDEIRSAPNSGEILSAYSDECSLPELGMAHPSDEIYLALEKSRGMQVFGAYEDEILVGFSIVLTYIQPHYGKMVATTESIFILKGNRKAGLGRMLMMEIEKYAKEKGCSVFLYSAPSSSQFSKVLSSGSYRKSHSVFLRKL